MEYIYFWLSKFVAELIIFIVPILIFGVLWALYATYKYISLNHGKLARKYKKEIFDALNYYPLGVPYSKLAIMCTGKDYGHLIFDQTSNRKDLNQFLYTFRKMQRNKQIQVIYTNGERIVIKGFTDEFN